MARLLSALQIIRHPPRGTPSRSDCCSETSNHNERTGISAGIYVPSHFLRCPNCIHEDNMQSGFPKEERCRPCDICIELVVQTPCTQAAYHHRRKHSRQDEYRRDVTRDPLLSLFGRRREKHALDTAEINTCWSEPSRVQEREEQRDVDTQQRKREWLRQEDVLSNKAPVHRPLEHELPAELESSAKVAACVRAEELIAKYNLQES